MRSTFQTQLAFFGTFILAFALSYIPYLHQPLIWITTFFHEISHGIASILTGGSIVKIELNIDGSGLCTSRGGIPMLIAFAGYFGAVVWGATVFQLAHPNRMKMSNYISFAIAALIAISTILYARDLTTIAINIFIASIFILSTMFKAAVWDQRALRLIGAYVLLEAIRDPIYLFLGTNKGDAGALQAITGIPYTVWVAIWMLLGVIGIWLLWKWNAFKVNPQTLESGNA